MYRSDARRSEMELGLETQCIYVCMYVCMCSVCVCAWLWWAEYWYIWRSSLRIKIRFTVQKGLGDAHKMTREGGRVMEIEETRVVRFLFADRGSMGPNSFFFFSSKLCQPLTSPILFSPPPWRHPCPFIKSNAPPFKLKLHPDPREFLHPYAEVFVEVIIHEMCLNVFFWVIRKPTIIV